MVNVMGRAQSPAMAAQHTTASLVRKLLLKNRSFNELCWQQEKVHVDHI